jgi:formiminotetrahydrofolate cyclodeaminase
MRPASPRVALSELQVGEFLAALGERTPAPASGAATALTAALAASLVELAARFAGEEAVVTRAKALSTRLTQLADEDAEAYTAFMETKTEDARRRTIEVPEEIAANADEVARLAADVSARLTSSVAGDAEAAAELAHAAARIARRLAELNG